MRPISKTCAAEAANENTACRGLWSALMAEKTSLWLKCHRPFARLDVVIVDVKIVNAAPFIAIASSKNCDFHRDLRADCATTFLPWTIFECYSVAPAEIDQRSLRY